MIELLVLLFMELLVSMSIGMVVLAALAKTFTVQSRQNTAEEQVAQMQGNARAALDLMVREIQMAKYNPAGTAFSSAYGGDLQRIAVGSQSRHGWQRNTLVRQAAASRTSSMPVTPRIITSLRKLGSGTAEIVADNITAFTFAYYDANAQRAVTSSGNSGNIRKVTINISRAHCEAPDPSYTSNSGYPHLPNQCRYHTAEHVHS